jgi:hypothetical protein
VNRRKPRDRMCRICLPPPFEVAAVGEPKLLSLHTSCC